MKNEMELKLPPGNADPWETVLNTVSTSSTETPVSPTPPDKQLNLILTVITPICVIFTIMAILGVGCFINLWRKGRRRYHMDSRHYYRSHNTWDETKSSVGTQSNSNRKVSTPREYIPSLDRISESPEDRLRIRGNPFAIASEESILSVLSKLQFDVAEAAVNSHYMQGHDAANTSQSYPSLAVHPQPPFSPYHLTWVSPAVNRQVHSEPNIPSRSVLQRRLASADSGSIPSSLYNNSWRSPYHPSYNTPTEPTDINANVVPSNMVINKIPPAEMPRIRTMVSSADFHKRRSEPIFLTGEKVKSKRRDELILSASKLNLESRARRDMGNPFTCSSSGSTNTSSVCAVCSNTYTQKLQPNCDCCSVCVCQPQPNIPSTESLTGNVGSTETSIQQRRNQEMSFQNTDPVCHGSCDTTHSGEQSSSLQSQNNSIIYYPGPSHSTSLGPSANTSQNLSRAYGASLPTSALASRDASPTLTHDDTVCSAPARVHSSGIKDRMATSGTQTELTFDISSVSYVNGPPPPYRPQYFVERVSNQAVFNPCGIQPVSQESMTNLSTDVHRSMSHVPGRESSYEWDAYPFYPHHSSQNSGVNSSQSSSGIISRPVYPILSEVQHWV